MNSVNGLDSQNTGESLEKQAKVKFYQRTGFVFSYINLATLMQYVQIQFLSSSLRGLEKDMGFSPKKLSVLIIAEQVSFLAFVPLWGLLLDLYEIKYTLIATTLFGGIFIALFGLLREFFMMVVVRLFSGMLMGSSIPAGQKYVSLAKMKSSGRAFGIIHAFASFGRLLSAVLVTKFASDKYGGIYGWRICSFVLSFCYFFSALVLMLIPKMRPKNYNKSLYDIVDLSECDSVAKFTKAIWKRFLGIMRVKTVILITFLLFFGMGTHTAGHFMTLYVQYCRLSNFKAGIATSFLIISNIVSAIFGGFVADKIHAKHPKYGRITLGIVICFARLAILVGALYGLTFDNIADNFGAVAFSLFMLGSTFAIISFVDRSLFLDVVMPSEQSFGCSSVLFISGVTSGLIFPGLMGFLVKDVFGYRETTMDVEEMPYGLMRSNAFALRDGIVSLCIFSTLTTIIFYLFMYKTYHKDAKVVKDKLDSEIGLNQVHVDQQLTYKRTVSAST